MKKIILILLGIMLLTGCSSQLKTYNEISYSGLLKKVENKETFILYIGSSECSHCKEFKYTLDEVITEYQVKVSYLNIAGFSDSRYAKLKNLVTFGGSTPTVLFIKSGVANVGSGYNKIIGSQSKDFVIDKFKYNEYIK